MATNDTTTKRPDIEATISHTARTVAFVFGQPDLDDLVIDADALTADLFTYAALHGIKQKVGDAAAISRDPETGRSATLADKRAAMQRVVDRLLSGEWNAPRGEGGTGGLLVQALMQHTGKSRADIDAFLANKSKEEQAALRKNAKIAAIIASIQAARAAESGVDTDAMLGDLMA